MKKQPDLDTLLQEHHSRYPRSRIQDMVKLVYQNEFAGGHFVSDKAESLKRLREEAGLCPQDNAPSIAFEDIGNGLCRLHLRHLSRVGLEPETAHGFFVNTAETVCGSVQSLEAKLRVLRRCCADGRLPFRTEETDAYLDAYKRQGYPPVGHSGPYREAYRPAYRVVGARYRDYLDAFVKIDSLLRFHRHVHVAIDGHCGAGKSMLASLIGGAYECNVFHTDDFFLPPRKRTQKRLQTAGGNVYHERFKREVTEGLRSGRPFMYRRYDCKKDELGEPVPVTPQRLNIVEGSYSLHPALSKQYHLKIFMKVGKQEQLRRITERNGPDMLRRFVDEWIPLENNYFEAMDIEAQCDLVFRG